MYKREHMKDDVTDHDNGQHKCCFVFFFSPHIWFSGYFSVLRVVRCQGQIAEC